MTHDKAPEAVAPPFEQQVRRLDLACTSECGLTECSGKPMCQACRVRCTIFRGDLVRKRSGSAWEGIVCGEYSTALTPVGYAVESTAHPGSVQIYPAHALELVARGKTPNG